MARPRRLRHKLRLGLAVVVGSVALLLGGTLYGINAYLTTVRTTERKLEELQLLNILIDTLKRPDRPADDATAEYAAFRDCQRETKWQLDYYRSKHAETVARGLDPDGGEQEVPLINELEAALALFDTALAASMTGAGDGANQPVTGSLRNHPKVKPPYDRSRQLAEHLRLAVIDDIETSIRRSNKSIRQSVWVIGAATAWTVLMIGALLYYFRQWIYTPIKELQSGVQRVHGGDFDHPIQLHSQDELEELANEFNAMTARLSAIYLDLARQVNERSRQLVRSERMVSVGFLAAGVAHEINNPLASILFCAEALERRLQEVLAAAPPGAAAVHPHRPPDAGSQGDAEVLARYLKMIQQEALRCSRWPATCRTAAGRTSPSTRTPTSSPRSTPRTSRA